MRTEATNIRGVVDHLPPAATLVIGEVSWDEYLGLLEELDDRPGLRVTYDQGRLEIVTTSFRHEQWKEFILGLVRVISDELNIPIESAGGATQKRMQDAKGTEPDTCFYVTNAHRVIGKEDIDLEVDPPPDIVVEVDKSSQSLRKFPIYLAFGVPEIWRYDGDRARVEIYQIREGAYVGTQSSRFFPILTTDVLLDFLERSKTEGQTAALAAFRNWMRSRT